MRANIIEVVRQRGAEAYIGRTQRDSDMLLNYLGKRYFVRAEYEYALHTLGMYNMSLLVEEPFDEQESGSKPATGDPGDTWLH